jgi:hypothetical protein
MRITTINRPLAKQESDPLPPDPLAENLFAWAAPLTHDRDLVSGLVVLFVAGAALLASVLS